MNRFLLILFSAFFAFSLTAFSYAEDDDWNFSDDYSSSQTQTSKKKTQRAVTSGAVKKNNRKSNVKTQKNVVQKKKNTKQKKTKKKNSDYEIDQLPLPPAPRKNKKNSAESGKIEDGTSDPLSGTDGADPDFDAMDREYQAALAAEDAKKKGETESAEDNIPRELHYKMLSGWTTDSRDGRGADFSMKKNSASFVVIEEKEICEPDTVLKSSRSTLSKFKSRDNPSKLKPYAVKNGVSGYYFSLDDGRSKHFYAFFCAGAKTLSITLKNATDSLFEEAVGSLQMEPVVKKQKKNAEEKPKLKPVVYSTDIPVR